jgi:hypothetical protein
LQTFPGSKRTSAFHSEADIGGASQNVRFGAEARLGSARAYLIETLTTIYARADDVAPIEVTDRARLRLACTNAIQGAVEVADFAYKGAGVDAIFPGSPFERRFRDMHTLQARLLALRDRLMMLRQTRRGRAPVKKVFAAYWSSRPREVNTFRDRSERGARSDRR